MKTTSTDISDINCEKAERPRFCHYCECAAPLHDKGKMLCERFGVVTDDYVCRRWRYDPLKRDPKAPRPVPEISQEELL